MKMNRFFSCFTSICVGIGVLSTPVSIAANAENNLRLTASAQDGSILQETAYDYEGAFKVSSYPWFNWVGEELDFSETKLELLVMNSDGKFSATVLPFSFTVQSGLYSDYYTIDTSAVDITTEGDYVVNISTKAGEIITVSKDKDYRIKLTDHVSPFTAQYHERPAMLQFSNGSGGNDQVNCLLNETCTVSLNNVNGSEIISCAVSDPSIAEIVEVNDRKDFCNYKIQGLQLGETVITAETADGRTASCEILVVPFEEMFPDTTTDCTTIVSYSESTTTTATTPTALPDTTEDTTTTSSEQGHDKLYQGYLVRHDYQPYYYVGDSFDYDRLQLCLFVLGEDGTLHDELMYCRFFASEEKYQNCYTVDTSAVDFSTPGDYEVTLRMNPGERALFHSKASTVKGSLPEGDYNVEMIDYSMTFTVSVMQRQDPDKLFFTPDYREYPLGGTYELLLRNAKDKDISCEIEDETIAVIRGCRESGKNIYYSVELLAEGETTLTAVSSDGQTASVKLLSLTQEEYDRRTHTTMISSNTTTTTTTATTADTADFSDTTEISQNSTDSSAVTTSLSGDTETSTTSADLPQTGNHSPRNLLIVLGASWLIGFGMLAVVKSGVIRRRKDEQ